MRRWLSTVTVSASLTMLGGPAFSWSFIEAGSAGTSDAANAVLIGSTGDVISGGFIQNPTPETVLVRHSGANGSERWRFSVPGVANDPTAMHLFEDARGNVVAAIHLYESRYTPGSSEVVKLSPAGVKLWHVELPSVWIYAADQDESGAIVVAGRVPTANAWDLFVAMFDSAGSELWQKTISGTVDAAADEQARAIRFDSAGDVIVGGGLLVNAALGLPDFAVIKLSGATGAELWRHIVPSNAAHGGRAWSVALDPTGDIVAVGEAVIVDWCDAVAVKLSSADGSELWRTVIDEPTTGSCDQLSAVTTNEDGDVFVTGAPRTILYSVFKLSGATGAPVWRHDFPNLSEPTGGGCCGGKAIAVRDDGSVVSMGIRLGPTQTGQIAVARLDPADGHELFLRIIDTDGCGDGYPAATLGPDGDIAIAASVFRRIDGECIWPQGYDYGVFKFTGLSGLDFWGGCQDERDNDGDGLIDLADPYCTDPTDQLEAPPLPSQGCGLGSELVVLLPVLRLVRRRSHRKSMDRSAW